MGAAIYGPGLFVVGLFVTALGIWAAIDAGRQPSWAFKRAGQNKTLWIVLPIVGIFLCGIITVVSAIIWYVSIRPKVTAAASGGFPTS